MRERIGRVLLRVYPPGARAARSEEMLGTLLEASEGSLSSFFSETTSLLLAGIRERARITSRMCTSHLVADAIRGAIPIWIAFNLAGVSLLRLLTHPHGLSDYGVWLMLLWPILAITLLGHDRAAGALGVAWIVGSMTPLGVGGLYRALIAFDLLPLAGFALMLIAPRRSRRHNRRLCWLLPVAVISLVAQPAVLAHGTLGVAGLSLMSLMSLIVFVSDPRLSIACALVWSSIGIVYVERAAWSRAPVSPAVLLTATAPLIAAVAIGQLWLIRRHTTVPG